jgi:hypothetical protein
MILSVDENVKLQGLVSVYTRNRNDTPPTLSVFAPGYQAACERRLLGCYPILLAAFKHPQRL